MIAGASARSWRSSAAILARRGAGVACSRHASTPSFHRSWVEHPPETDFPLANLPFGVFSRSGGRGSRAAPGGEARCATAIGEHVVDLAALASAGLLEQLPFDARAVFQRPSLNAFMALSRREWRATRARLTELLAEGGDGALRTDAALQRAVLFPMVGATMHLPAEVGDYTDFYSSREHATNVGIMFRGKDNALQPNWLHLPVGYHGRASSVVVSGTPIVRPRGQLQKDNDDPMQGAVYGPSKLLDMELEVGLFVGGKTPPLGKPIGIEEAEEYIFGLVLMNDWSARDIQKWEYVPLGPFGSKNFGTTISPWVVTLDALEPFRCATSAGVQDDPVPLEYLRDPSYGSYDIALEVDHLSPTGAVTTITKSNFRHMYWNIKQQLVHHSVTGCNMRPGDLLGSGTISGTSKGSYGSMLELTWRGAEEIKLSDGDTRKFLKDYDTLNIRGVCGGVGGLPRIGFGACSGQILPAGSYDGAEAPCPEERSLFKSFVLHSYWRSSCSWRVRIALAYYGIDFATKPVHLVRDGGEQLLEGYRSGVNPMAQVPALTVTDDSGASHTLTQSMAIIDFLDSLGSPAKAALVPRGEGAHAALRRARALEIAELFGSGIQPLQNLDTLKAVKSALTPEGEQVDARGWAASKISRGLAAAERLAQASAGRFAVGNEVSVADVFLVPQLYNARRFGVDLVAFPTLLRVEAACSQLPFFRAAHPDSQPDAEAGIPP